MRLTLAFGPLVPGDTFLLTVEVVDAAGATIAALAPISITVPLDVPTGTYVPVTGVALKWTPIAPAVKPPVML
jgi:hypothetical protein